jgi:hypothetical protein
VLLSEHGVLDDAPADTTAYFSSAGPAASGGIKPDLVAPGANVIGAMSASADPRGSGRRGLFDSEQICLAHALTSACFVVDDFHAVSSGTSMAAPLVSGAVALLFQRNPTLDQERVRALLQAGTRALTGVIFRVQQVGPGALDLGRVLEVLDLDAGGGTPRTPGARSRLVFADTYVHPDDRWPLEGLAILRDDEDRVADGFSAERLVLVVDGGALASGLLRVAPGLHRFQVSAPAGSGGRTLSLSLRYDGREVAAASMPIAVDRSLATELAVARGGCGVAPPCRSPVGPSRSFALLGTVLMLGLARGRSLARQTMRARRVRAAQSSTT